METKLTKSEKNILIQLKFNHCWEKSGSLTKRQRLEKLTDLQKRGYLNEHCQVTEKANVELSIV